MDEKYSQFNNRILEKMPYPLAKLYFLMLNEKNPRIKFRDLVKVFIGVLKYLSIICIAEYMENPDSTQVNKTLSRSLQRPSLGHWMQFLREIIKHYKKKKQHFCITELSGVLNKRTNKLIEHMIHLRNTYVHSDIMPEEEISKTLFIENMPYLHELLLAFGFVADYPLIHIVLEGSNKNTETKVMGHDIIEYTRSDHFQFIIRSMSGKKDLNITPFMMIFMDDKINDLLVYETLVGNRAKYILGNTIKFLTYNDDLDNRVQLLQKLFSKFTDNDEINKLKRIKKDQKNLLDCIIENSDVDIPPLHSIKNLSDAHSELMFKNYRDDGRYNPQTYVQREVMEKAYEKLFRGSENIMIMVADSGVGKSTEICHLYIEKFPDDFVWIISGRTVQASSLLSVIKKAIFGKENPIQDMELFFSWLDKKRIDQKFIILLDGINETDNPTESFRCMDELVNANPYEWLKIIITCRSFAWEIIKNSGFVPDKHRYVFSDFNKLANVLEPFNEIQLRKAIKKYATFFKVTIPNRWNDDRSLKYNEQKFIESPLILRFLFEAFKESKIPDLIDVETIMKAFRKERLRKRDLPFLYKYLMSYYYREETDLLNTMKLIDYSIDGFNDFEEVEDDDRKAYMKLLDHICSEQVYNVDIILCCKRRDCVRYEKPVLTEDKYPNPRCPICRELLQQENIDNRSTYSRLLNLNIISKTEFSNIDSSNQANKDDTNSYFCIRIIFDKYFEYLMQHYCFEIKMHKTYKPEIVKELFEKAKRQSIFIEPLKGVIMQLWKMNEHKALHQIASMKEFEAYHILRNIFKEYATNNFIEFKKILCTTIYEIGFNTNICRAGVHAMLIDSHIAKRNTDEIVDILFFLSENLSEQLYEDIGDYIVALRWKGIDLISPVMNKCCTVLFGSINLLSAFHIGLSAINDKITTKKSRQIKGQANLLLNVILFGLGNFFNDKDIQNAVINSGLPIIQKLLRHPLLAFFGDYFAKFVSRRIAKAYKEKGPLPCNYFEMVFQLHHDPGKIIQAGNLFDVDHQNLFDYDYEIFKQKVHSENGLISWYILSILPSHYLNASDKTNAIAYMKQIIKEGTEMDRHRIGETVSILLQKKGVPHRNLLKNILKELGNNLIQNPSYAFLRPKSVEPIPASETVTDFNYKLSQEINKTVNPYAVPWIVNNNSTIDRIYINTLVFHILKLRLEEERPNVLLEVIDLLDFNSKNDLLKFGEPSKKTRNYVITFLIQSLSVVAVSGYLKEVFATIDRIITLFILEKNKLTEKSDQDIPNNSKDIEVYRWAVVDLLKRIKDYHRYEVLAFLESYDLNDESLKFLIEIKTSAGEKEKFLSKSLYGHNIYQGAFTNKELRETFGKITKLAGKAKDVEEFFFIYSKEFMQYMKNYGRIK